MDFNRMLLLAAFIIALGNIKAQENPEFKKGFKYNNNFDLSLAANSDQFVGALSWVHFIPTGKKQKFKIGYGLRFNSQFGSQLNFVTAPAIITSKQEGPQVLFSETFNENVDTLFVSKSQVNSLNASINLQYTFKNKLDIGFNIDAVGFSFGKEISGTYIDNQSSVLLNGSQQMAKPTALNALLVSDNDIGSLNSELYVRYWFNKKLAIKAGASFYFTEYTTTNKLRLENDRWRNKSLMGMIGVTFNPFNE